MSQLRQLVSLDRTKTSWNFTAKLGTVPYGLLVLNREPKEGEKLLIRGDVLQRHSKKVLAKIERVAGGNIFLSKV
jgi:hypothetical protein